VFLKKPIRIIHLAWGAYDGLFHRDGPIQSTRFDHEMIQSRVFGDIDDPVAVAVVLQRVHNRPAAYGAMHDEVEHSGAGRGSAFGLPLDAPLGAVDIERFGLRIAAS